MFKRLIILIVIGCFILSMADTATCKETITGVGVAAVKDVVEKLGRAFAKKNPSIQVKTKEDKVDAAIKAVGTSKDGSLFGMINRPLNDKEKSAYPDIQTFLFAKDGVAIIVHPANPVKSITPAQLKDIIKGKITNWSQLGGKKEVISMIMREKASNQRVAFEKVIMGGEKVPIGRVREISSMGDVKTEVALDKSAIGYILISALDKKVKPLELDGVAPTIANVKAGTYPITIPYYLITKGEPKGAIKTFMDFIITTEGQALVEKEKIGFVTK
ncbi:MAG: phosphate ABC transporter substrate-binding protein [Thermodesulfovibrionales bacterium]|nr:phosphate ABC transporter substrate-binding protein [Thermodesulfovibrionales bacterium]